MKRPYTFKEYIQLAFCEKGSPSCKRITGFIMILFVLSIMLVSLIMYGVTPFLEALCQTSLISGTSLIGLATVTSIFRNGDKEIISKAGNTNEELDENN